MYLSDNQFEDGIERSTFEHAIDHVITRRFGWSQAVADIVKNKYTDWTKRNDPIENRNQYVHVRYFCILDNDLTNGTNALKQTKKPKDLWHS